MLKNYFVIAVRNISRNKVTSFINIFSLSIGLACAILVSMIVIYEKSFDDFHAESERVFRVYTEVHRGDEITDVAPVQFPFAKHAKQEVPEIEESVVITEFTSLVTYGDNKFYENLYATDKSFFSIFNFPLKIGEAQTALEQPYSMLISEDAAVKYFGDKNPVGEIVKVRSADLFTVTGVFKTFPNNSSLSTDFIISNNQFNAENFNRFDAWTSFGNDYCFVKLHPNSNTKVIEDKLLDLNNSNMNAEFEGRYKPHLQPLSEVHFADLTYDFLSTTPIMFLYIFSIIAFFFLLIACVNFINLSTAKSSKRSKEVGIRKVAGANRIQLIKQFMSEAFVLTIISFMLALLFVNLILPYTNSLLRSQISFSLLNNFEVIITMILVFLFTGFVSGIYPAFVLSKHRPVIVLKNSLIKKKGGYSSRAALVVFQFAISVFLIVGTLTVYSQIDYMLTKDLGFAKDRIVVISLDDENLRKSVVPLKSDLLTIPEIESASFSSGTPASNYSSGTSAYTVDADPEIETYMQLLEVDYDFIDTYSLKLKEGRFFDKKFATDTSNSVVINKTAAKQLGYANPVGKYLKLNNNDRYEIVGVLDDFHYSSLRNNIPSMALFLNPDKGRFLSLTLAQNNIVGTIGKMKEIYSEHSPNYPFEYFFLNERFESYYRAERSVNKILGALSVLAIFISSIGILGLVAFTTEQKSKEIGIRKVLGASARNIVVMLSMRFLFWVVIANIIIWPISYLLLDQWLNSFAYRSDLNLLIFAAAFGISILITLATVGYHSLKAAMANPVKSLKYE